MSDISTQVGDDPSGDPNIKQLRERAKRTEDAEAALQAANRKVAILESGLDVESPIGQLFVKGYDGEFTAEALKAEAEKYGVPIKGAAPATETVVEEPTEPTGTAERTALSDGAPADTGEDLDPRETSRKNFDTALAAGAPRDVAAGAMLNELANAAHRGDERVIVKDR